MIPVHSEVNNVEVTPMPTGDGVNVLIISHKGVRIEFGFGIELALKLRNEAQQSLTQCGHIRAAAARDSQLSTLNSQPV